MTPQELQHITIKSFLNCWVENTENIQHIGKTAFTQQELFLPFMEIIKAYESNSKRFKITNNQDFTLHLATRKDVVNYCKDICDYPEKYLDISHNSNNYYDSIMNMKVYLPYGPGIGVIEIAYNPKIQDVLITGIL